MKAFASSSSSSTNAASTSNADSKSKLPETGAPKASAVVGGRKKSEMNAMSEAQIESIASELKVKPAQVQATAVLLAKFEHLSYSDIGDIMGMTPQAIKSLLSRISRFISAMFLTVLWKSSHTETVQLAAASPALRMSFSSLLLAHFHELSRLARLFLLGL